MCPAKSCFQLRNASRAFDHRDGLTVQVRTPGILAHRLILLPPTTDEVLMQVMLSAQLNHGALTAYELADNRKLEISTEGSFHQWLPGSFPDGHTNNLR